METNLEAPEIRVLGALIEKQLSTPDYYPMTLNALIHACNQKSNRDPVVTYRESDVLSALDTLQHRRLVGTATGVGSRAVKYRHALAEAWSLSAAALAVLAELLLRGPRTVGELRGRTGRMHTFEDTGQVQEILTNLASREAPLALQLPRRAGQKEARFAHLLAGAPSEDPVAPPPAPGRDRIGALEDDIAQLKDRFASLEALFESFRRQLE